MKIHLTSIDGASLVYTTPNVPSQLQSLVHSSLGITSLIKRQPLKQNVIDRDKIVVPPNWDSWGKIRVLRDGFDVEAISNGWSSDLSATFPSKPISSADLQILEQAKEDGQLDSVMGSAVALYEHWIPDPSVDALQLGGGGSDPSKLELSSEDGQAFLEMQLSVLEGFRIKSEQAKDKSSLRTSRRTDDSNLSVSTRDDANARVNEHIGPVQFNMGGIQVDADDMVQRLKVWEEHHMYTLMVQGAHILSTRTARLTQPLRTPRRHQQILQSKIQKWRPRNCRLSSAV
jgi:dynein light intermediate chain 1, cytosolic